MGWQQSRGDLVKERGAAGEEGGDLADRHELMEELPVPHASFSLLTSFHFSLLFPPLSLFTFLFSCVFTSPSSSILSLSPCNHTSLLRQHADKSNPCCVWSCLLLSPSDIPFPAGFLLSSATVTALPHSYVSPFPNSCDGSAIERSVVSPLPPLFSGAVNIQGAVMAL